MLSLLLFFFPNSQVLKL